MATTVAPTELTADRKELDLGSGGPGRNGGDDGDRGGGGGSNRGGSRKPLPLAAYRLGMTFALASIAMFFIGLTSSYVVRHGLDPDWLAIEMPPVLLFNTLILLASSMTLETARRALNNPKDRGLSGYRKWLRLTLMLGLVFLYGQLMAWRQLMAYGINLSSSAHSSFFYLLTGLHALHLLGGILALSYLVWKAQRARGFAVAGGLHNSEATANGTRAFDVIALYWHSMDALWIYLFVLLFGYTA